MTSAEQLPLFDLPVQPDEAAGANDGPAPKPETKAATPGKRAKRLSLEITFYVVLSGNEQFTEQGSDAFGEVPRLQVGARDRPLKGQHPVSTAASSLARLMTARK
jgi:hypothetical protein